MKGKKKLTVMHKTIDADAFTKIKEQFIEELTTKRPSDSFFVVNQGSVDKSSKTASKSAT